MQFGFINVLITFLKKFNYILEEYLDDFIMAYLNNIIIYLNTEQEYEEHIEQVLKKLYKKDIPIIIKKCEFHTRKTNFIKFIIKLR